MVHLWAYTNVTLIYCWLRSEPLSGGAYTVQEPWEGRVKLGELRTDVDGGLELEQKF